MTREWDGIQTLPRPVPVEKIGGLLVDVFYRRRLDLWIVWTYIPTPEGAPISDIIMLGAFHDRARARFAADTAIVAANKESNIMPMMLDLLDDNDGNFIGVLHGISHVADAAPWFCEHTNKRKVLSPLARSDLLLLNDQIERYTESCQDWRFIWLEQEGVPYPALVRIKGETAAAAIVMEDATFATDKVTFWLDGAEHEIPCAPTSLAENPLGDVVLANLGSVMRYCDTLLDMRYGAGPSNASALLATLKEENHRESVRQMAEVFGTSHFIGQA